MKYNCKNCKNSECMWIGLNDEEICTEYVPKTKGDLLRCMTDEELADLLSQTVDCACCPCKASDDKCDLPDESCKKQWIEWLKQGFE